MEDDYGEAIRNKHTDEELKKEFPLQFARFPNMRQKMLINAIKHNYKQSEKLKCHYWYGGEHKAKLDKCIKWCKDNEMSYSLATSRTWYDDINENDVLIVMDLNKGWMTETDLAFITGHNIAGNLFKLLTRIL